MSFANGLLQQLNYAWNIAPENQDAVCVETKSGIYLEFRGEPGYELVTKSLEDLHSANPDKRIRLCNIRKSEREDKPVMATVFVPKDKKRVFFKKITQYKNTCGDKSPKNSSLIESISEIKRAVEVESFWTDSKELIPENDSVWCEIWLRTEDQDYSNFFLRELHKHDIEVTDNCLLFPERSVIMAKVNKSQLADIIHWSNQVAEFRRAKELSSFWLEQSPSEQTKWVENLLKRTEIDTGSDNYSVCILDTGVNRLHPLLEDILLKSDCQTVYPLWGKEDHDGHGTLMAGIAAYGDLAWALENVGKVKINHMLESVKIFSPTEGTNPELWGGITSQGVSLSEIQTPKRKKIFCTAITSEDTRDRGRPSSWSAQLDQIISGTQEKDRHRRLFIVSAGNCSTPYTPYPDKQFCCSIHDPAQSWNALTVGAYTAKNKIIDDNLIFPTDSPIAPKGAISPFTSTSLTCDKKWPVKPDILMEGGNVFKNGCQHPDLMSLSTYYKPSTALFDSFGMTSAATAKAAWVASQIQVKYPNYWPETIRALMIHSAEWTDAMKRQFEIGPNSGKKNIENLIRCCGYGVPDLHRALYCASNSLTLVIQKGIQPFEKTKKGIKTKEMHLYELPWPKEILQGLHETEVEMRVTLSYFIEPGPGEIGWQDRYRYPSHLLRFDLTSPGESEDEFIRRINAAARNEENGKPDSSSAAKHWTIGARARNKGSIHSDIWRGSAADLADSNLVAVYPANGWWKERKHLECGNNTTRYSLIVSIKVPDVNVDIYTPVATQISVSIST
ncbi:S8 family peptidase [Aminobacterium sp. UBA5514]|uniref:S8 family peptidase n=1 Tax=Aminobacterium sp. UBA5514 TaxID=1946036 RepID=UPI00257DF1DA|nr:S8 family peptidase [Aminobacterium sp. UBA5514]